MRWYARTLQNVSGQADVGVALLTHRRLSQPLTPPHPVPSPQRRAHDRSHPFALFDTSLACAFTTCSVCAPLRDLFARTHTSTQCTPQLYAHPPNKPPSTTLSARSPAANTLTLPGFGSIGRGCLPLVLKHMDMPADKITIFTAEDCGKEAEEDVSHPPPSLILPLSFPTPQQPAHTSSSVASNDPPWPTERRVLRVYGTGVEIRARGVRVWV
jgi:hypothetical protein